MTEQKPKWVDLFGIDPDYIVGRNNSVSWNYRVTKQTVDLGDLGSEEEYAIREVYYDESGEIKGWTQDAMAPMAESMEELIEVLRLMVDAYASPVLDLDEMGSK